MKRFVSAIAMVAVAAVFMSAQQTDLAAVLLRSENYIGQRADNSKDKSGTGILKISGGGVYIGDINRNKFNGKGMVICGDKGKIANAPDAYAYVGGFVGGKKQGKGTCYAPDGDIIYSGRFENDKPVDAYPSVAPDELRYFSIMETFDGYYIGEVESGNAHGFGLCVLTDGAFRIGISREGIPIGVNTLIYGSSEWTVVNYRDGQAMVINTSADYNERNSIIKNVNSQIWNELWSGMAEVASGLSDVGMQYMKARVETSGGNYNDSHDGGLGSASSTGTKKTSGVKNSSKKGNDCGTAWMSGSRIYGDYENQLAKGGQLSTADINDIKSKMRAIRTKWEKRGCPFTKSPYE
ncbi:MAG: hypothetical protein K2I26_08435 [Paramuribaculum sp.]|nr:hypothetical protein [Paramuribaculum sp.]